MRKLRFLSLLTVVVLVFMTACQPKTVIVEKEKEVTKVVEKEKVVKETVVVKEEVTKIVEKPVEIEKVVTATPIPVKFKESPMLTNLVERGKLPPVEERLPSNPMVVEPLVEQGAYGGSLRFGFVGQSAAWGGLLYLAGWDHLVIWRPDFNSIEPNAVAGWDISPDVTEYTFYLRKGMKWSDGEPFTSEDLRFFIEDVLANEELFPGGLGGDWIPTSMREGFKVQVIDDYTIKFIFPKPYGTFLYVLATWSGRQFTQYPAHYLKQFHKKYNPNVDELVKADPTAENWTALFFKKAPDTWGNPQRFFEDPNLPTLGPWMTVQPLGTGTTIILERNPYYWKVDTEGNQLPYIDQIIGTSFQDDQSRTFAMLNGDLDWIKDPGALNRELYYEAMDAGKPIRVVQTWPDGGNTQSIHFNLSFQDPVKNQVFNDKNFRIGMSYAIDRDEIIEVVFKGQGKPAQVCPLESSPLYNKQLCEQYIEYDVKKANEYLDKVLPNKDAEGYRLGPDGKRFVPIFSVTNDLSYGTHYVQVAEMLISYWKAVGVEVQLDAVTDAVFNESRRKNNSFEMYLFHGGEGGAGLTAILDPRWHVPDGWWSMFAWGWVKWFHDTTGEDEYAVEPPDYAKEVREMYLKAIQQPTVEKQIEAMKKIMEKSAEYFWTIGISRPGPGYQPLSTRLGNVPDGYWDGWLEGVHKIIRPEQWYLK